MRSCLRFLVPFAQNRFGGYCKITLCCKSHHKTTKFVAYRVNNSIISTLFLDVTHSYNSQPNQSNRPFYWLSGWAYGVHTLASLSSPPLTVSLQVVVVRNGRIVFTQKVDYEPPCVSINHDLTEVAVGGAMVNVRPLTRGQIHPTSCRLDLSSRSHRLMFLFNCFP